MADMGVRVRLDADSGQLVGQLSAAEQAERDVAQQARDMGTAANQGAAGLTGMGNKAGAAATQLGQTSAAEQRVAQEARDMGTAATAGAAGLDRMGSSARRANVGLAQVEQGQRAASRASTQLGFQIQDITQGLSMGVNPMVVFGQQAGQTASALSLMGGTAGRVGTFLAGPWGSLILAGVTVAGLFATSLLDVEEAADDVEFTTYKLGEAQTILGNIFDLTTGKIKDQTEAMLVLTRVQLAAGRIEAMRDQREARDTFDEINRGEVRLESGMMGGLRFERRGDGTEDIIRLYQRGDNTAAQAEAQLRNRLDTGSITEEAYLRAAGAISQEGIATANLELFTEAEAALNGDGGALQQFLRPGRNGGNGRNRQDNTERELQRLQEFGERAAESVQRINERFGEQPKLVTQAAQATRQLDAIIADLQERQPPGFEATIASAQEARQVVEASLLRPFQEMMEASNRQIDQQELILAGRENEAEALRRIQQLVDRVGFATEEQREAILANVEAEARLNEQLKARQELISAYQGAIASVRGDLEGLLGGFGGEDFLDNFQRSFQRLRGQVLTEQLFGPALRELDEYVRQNTGISTGVDIMREGTEQAGGAAVDLAAVLTSASQRVDGLFRAAESGGTGDTFEAAFDRTFGVQTDPAAQETADNTGQIVVTGQAMTRSAMGLSPEEFFARMAQDVASPLLDGLDDLFGIEFFGQLQGAMAGALAGYARAGTVGGVLGGLQGLVQDPNNPLGLPAGVGDFLGKQLGTALGGAQTGTLVKGLADALGIGISGTGAQIGGAIGSFLPIPGGDIIGSIAGGILGKLLGGSKRGSAIVTGVDNDLGTYGNSSSRKDAALSLGGSVQSGVASIAEALGAQTGAFRVSIGLRDDDFRVDTQGRGYTKMGNAGVFDFGQDERAAISFAIADAIKDGAIVGLTAAQNAALKSSSDVEKAVEEALKVKQLEESLGGFADAAARAFRDFETQAQERLRIATTYGLEVNKVEELNARERLALREQLERESFGSLQDLLDRMRSGDLFEGSSVDRRAALLQDIEAAKADALAGEEGAADRLAALLDDLNSVSRDAFGTTGGFATDRSSIEEAAQGVIDTLRAQLDAVDPSVQNPQIDTTNALLDESNGQLAAILAELRRNGGTLPSGAPAGYLPSSVADLAYTGGSSSGGSRSDLDGLQGSRLAAY